jgi:predicted nucleic acid-binding protein
MKKMFIDTGAWVALNNKKDSYHRVAVRANREFLDNGYFYVTSNFVFDKHFEQYKFIRLPNI